MFFLNERLKLGLRPNDINGVYMFFKDFTDVLSALLKTTKRIEMTNILANLFRKSESNNIDKIVYIIQGKLYPDYIGLKIGLAEKLVAKAISNVSGTSLENIEQLTFKFGDIGSAAEQVLQKKPQTTLFSEPLTVEKVYNSLNQAAKTEGRGGQETKLNILSGILGESTPNESKFIVRLVVGTLRLGVADYTILDGLSEAFTGGKENRDPIERAYNITNNLGLVAKTLAQDGVDALKNFHVSIGKPIRPMLAERLSTAQDVIEKIGGEVSAEYKLDGERVQIHKEGSKIILFSRRLENITNHFPDVIKNAIDYIIPSKAIVEGEIVAVNTDTGELRPFQELMHRKRKYEVEKAMEMTPTMIFLFDILLLESDDLTQKPYSMRRNLLEKNVKESTSIKVMPRLMVSTSRELEIFMNQAISDGCEGLVVKDPNSTYRAGAREFSWIKLKREYRSELADTLDLVIIGAFYGKGKRAGKYGTYLLAAYDKEKDIFESISKVGTGFTDEDLEKFQVLLDQYKLSHKHSRVNSKINPDIWFLPQIVIEVAASEITLSPIYTVGYGVFKDAGLALRFPKFTGKIRDDKGPEDATTVNEVTELYKRKISKISTNSPETIN